MSKCATFTTTIKKSGNSRTVVIPKEISRIAEVRIGDVVDITIRSRNEDGQE